MKKILSLLFTLPILLTSCGTKISTVPAYLNGNLFGENTITQENAFITAEVNTLSHLIDSKESFILYVKEASCYACSLVTPRLVKYVSNTKRLVYSIDAETQSDTFNEFARLYHDEFYPDNQILFPTIFVYSKDTSALKIPYAKYSSDTMLANAIDEYIVSTNVYFFETTQSLNNFVEDTNDAILIAYDRTQDDYVNAFHLHVENVMNEHKGKVALLNLSEYSEAERASLSLNYGISTTAKLSLYKVKNKEVISSLDVTNNHNEVIDFFNN